jgi:arylsulfatase A-like enzyme
MKNPNLLILMTDQMQERVLDPESPCITPNLDKLAAGGVRFKNAYSSNAVCSPARAGIMTGLLPHNHGVLTVTHCADKDQSCLRTDKPHWAQKVQAAGYDTAYFGKWHVENTECPTPFGWNIDFSMHSENYQRKAEKSKSAKGNITEGKKISIPG